MFLFFSLSLSIFLLFSLSLSLSSDHPSQEKKPRFLPLYSHCAASVESLSPAILVAHPLVSFRVVGSLLGTTKRVQVFFLHEKKIMTCMLILLPQAIPSSRSCDDAFGEVLASGALEGSNVTVPGEGLVHVNLALYPLITPLSLRLCLRCNISSFFLNCRFLLKIMRFFRCTIPSIHACPACAVPTELSVLESLPMLEHSSSWVRFLSLLVFYG